MTTYRSDLLDHIKLYQKTVNLRLFLDYEGVCLNKI